MARLTQEQWRKQLRVRWNNNSNGWVSIWKLRCDGVTWRSWRWVGFGWLAIDG